MTSTEFAAKYRLLKNVATRGARSFLAQQVELGRMVMVHYLDPEPSERATDALARLRSLTPAGRDKLLEILQVDGAPVAVTLFISSFVDFSTWLDQVSGSTRPASAPTSPRGAGDGGGGEFTRVFGKVETTPVPGDLSRPQDSTAPVVKQVVPPPPHDFLLDSPTLIIPAIEPPLPTSNEVKASAVSGDHSPVSKAPRAPAIEPPFVARKEPAQEPSFTAIFGSVAPAPSMSPLPPSLPAAAAPPPPALVMPPFFPEPERPVSPERAAPPQAAAPAGEFTQLFQRLGASAVSDDALTSGASRLAPSADRSAPLTPPAFPSASAAVPAAPSFGATPVPSPLPLTPPAPVFGSPNGSGAPAAPAASAPVFGDTPADTPALGVLGAKPWGQPIVPGPSAPSEFTRILGRVPALVPTASSASGAAPAVAPAAGSAETPAPTARKSYLPLIIALNVLLVATIAIVLYFVLKR